MRKTLVYGPAYWDRVLMIDRPLLPGQRFDGSVDGTLDNNDGPPALFDRAGHEIGLLGIDVKSRPLGSISLDCAFAEPQRETGQSVQVISDVDMLGGMGAGFAAALNGTLISALGAVGDPVGDRISAMLAEQGVSHQSIRVTDRTSDWSLIVSSGPFGDKLAVGFRGCHSAVASLKSVATVSTCELLVVAAWPNRLIAEALETPAQVRLLAPAMRNARDVKPSLASLAGRFDILSLNRSEWAATPHRLSLLNKTPIVVVTDGPLGCEVTFRDRDGSSKVLAFPAFPRQNPPRDTNRAGEAFASTFVKTLLSQGWIPGPADESLVRLAALRGSAAAALVLDIASFGFASEQQIDQAIRKGVV
jgi:ribokinase